MPTRFTEFHISSPVPSLSLRAKDHLEGTKVAVSPRYCAEQKVQTGSAAAGGHRRVATRETTGDLATRRGAGDPETRAEWMKVLRYGHLRSAPVVVDVGIRTGWEPPTLRAACPSPRARHGRLLDGFLPLRRRAHASALPLTKCGCEREGPKLRERCRVKRTKIAKTQRRVEYRARFPHNFTPSRAVGVAAPPCPGEQGACRDQQ